MKRGLLLLLCVMQSFIFVLHAQNTQRNIAYTDGNVRFTVISDGAIRPGICTGWEIRGR